MARIEKLLTKTLKIFAGYALFVLAASVPAYYYFIDGIWLSELDEHNELVAQKIERELLKFDLEDVELAKTIALWAQIQEGTSLTAISKADLAADSSYTFMKQNEHKAGYNIDRFRGLIKTVTINGHYYRLEIETNVEETEETMLAISGITFVFFCDFAAWLFGVE